MKFTLEEKNQIKLELLKAFWKEVNAIHIRNKVEFRQLSQDSMVISDSEALKGLVERKSRARIAKETTATTLKLIEDEIENLFKV